MTAVTDPTRRHLLGAGGLALGIGPARPAPSDDALAGHDRTISGPDVIVSDFGAVGDGMTDDTAAFNRATLAAASWSPAVERRIIVPPGRYRLGGTVFVRKGQELAGAGYATQIDARRTTARTFVLGQGEAGDDPGGAPVRLSGLRALGSAPRAPFIDVRALGFSIEGLFLTAMGTAIRVQGADGVIRDVIIDQALNGIVLDHAQNVLISSVYCYLVNYALTFATRCADVHVSNVLVAYSRYASVLFGEGGEHLRGINFADCSFVQNEQFETFSAVVQSRSSSVDALFSACSFRNWPGFAIEHGAGRDVTMLFNGCVFDAARTNPVYNQSATAAVLTTGLGGAYRFNDCTFRHLAGPIVRVRPGATAIAVAGGAASDCRTPLFVSEAPDPPLSIANMTGLAQPQTTSGAGFVLASWPGAAWRLSIRWTDAQGSNWLEEVFVDDRRIGGPFVQRLAGADPSDLAVTVRAGPPRLLQLGPRSGSSARIAALSASSA